MDPHTLNRLTPRQSDYKRQSAYPRQAAVGEGRAGGGNTILSTSSWSPELPSLTLLLASLPVLSPSRGSWCVSASQLWPYQRCTIMQPLRPPTSLPASMASSSLEVPLPNLYAKGLTNAKKGKTLNSNDKTNTVTV